MSQDNMTFEECLDAYGSSNEDYCSQFDSGETPWFLAPFDFIGDLAGDFFGAVFGNIALFLLLVLGIIFLVMSVKIVEQKEVLIIQRAGRYHRSLHAGPHMIIPILDRIRDRVDLEQFQIAVRTGVKTKEDQFVTLPVQVIARVIPDEAHTSIYEVEEPRKAIQALISTEVKARAAEMTLQDIFDDRESITKSVIDNQSETIESYGFEITKVVIDNPELSEEMQEAFNGVTIAERERIAATAQGEALKIKSVAKAQAEAAALKVQGEAFVVFRDQVAKGHSAAIQKMTQETGLTADAASQFLMSVDANDAVRDASANSATVVVATADTNRATLGLVAGARQ